MKPNKTIREMDSSKLLKAFEIEVNEYGGKRFDYLGEVMPRYNQNKIKMMRTELFRRLGLIEKESEVPTLILQLSKFENAIQIESSSNDEYIKLAEESNIEIRGKRYCPDNVECIKGAGCFDACIELDNLNVGMGKPKKLKENYMNNLLKKYGRNK